MMLKVAIYLTLSLSLAAQAACPETNLEGVFHNDSGDRFRIEQSNCEYLTIVNVTENKTVSLNLTGAQAVVSAEELSFLANTSSAFPMVYKATPAQHPDTISAVFLGRPTKTALKAMGMRSIPWPGRELPQILFDVEIKYLKNPDGKTKSLLLSAQNFRVIADRGYNFIEALAFRGLQAGLNANQESLTRSRILKREHD